MTLLISVLFILLATVVFVALVGLPIWIVIYLIKQYKKNKKLSVIQMVLIIIVGIMVVNFFRGLSAVVLDKVSQNYGVDKLQMTLPVK